MSAPLFEIEDVVYLVESAKVGSIESYQISGVRQGPSGSWMYRISVAQRPPNGAPTYGDRNTLRRTLDFELSESELTTYCAALDLAEIAAMSNLAAIRSLKAAHCTDGTGGTG